MTKFFVENVDNFPLVGLDLSHLAIGDINWIPRAFHN